MRKRFYTAAVIAVLATPTAVGSIVETRFNAISAASFESLWDHIRFVPSSSAPAFAAPEPDSEAGLGEMGTSSPDGASDPILTKSLEDNSTEDDIEELIKAVFGDAESPVEVEPCDGAVTEMFLRDIGSPRRPPIYAGATTNAPTAAPPTPRWPTGVGGGWPDVPIIWTGPSTSGAETGGTETGGTDPEDTKPEGTDTGVPGSDEAGDDTDWIALATSGDDTDDTGTGAPSLVLDGTSWTACPDCDGPVMTMSAPLTPVPLPGGGVLLIGGLAAFLTLRRRA